MMRSGFSIREAMDILEDEHNRACFEHIRMRLGSGDRAEDVISEVFSKTAYSSYLSGFLKVLPLKKALGLSVRMSSGNEEMKKQLVSEMVYPLAMFLILLCGSLLFSELCLPALLSMLGGFTDDLSSWKVTAILIRTVSMSMLGMLAGGMILMLVCTRRRWICRAYCLISEKHLLPLLSESVSARFILFFAQCAEMDLPTRQSLEVMAQMEDHPLICMLAREMDEALRSGTAFDEAMHSRHLDPSLYRFMRIAVNTDGAKEMMKSYLAMSEERMKRRLKRLSRLIRTVSYAGCGVLLIIVYQILMMPMNVLTQF
ncbi:MAG: type II secretion system F family protein [Solobacterium sp.]|nr:type II secretion system F family protein [Solobacterium sp.]